MKISKNSNHSNDEYSFEERQTQLELEYLESRNMRIRENYPGRNFMQVDKSGEAILKFKELSYHPIASRLLWTLIRYSNRLNESKKTVKFLAKDNECSEQSIYKAIRYLVDNDFIQIFKEGNKNVYVINDLLIWKTNLRDRKKCRYIHKEEASN